MASPTDRTSAEEVSDAPVTDGAHPLPSIEDVLADRAGSAWLKAALASALDRDPVDALNEALVLTVLLEARLREVLGIDIDPP